MRRRLVAAFDSFVDIGGMTDEQIAAKARVDGIAIAIDLQGYAERSRLSIFAHRAAPLQVTFLGYPGTTGAPFMDYMVADPTVVPGELRDAYSERLLVLPHSYQPNDRRAIAPGEWTREKAGLPGTGFVFACFNNNYKISRHEFGILFARHIEAAYDAAFDRWVKGEPPADIAIPA
jgi:predicted O-linked N-acetylglucosamine transferase (SPINDLY family)